MISQENIRSTEFLRKTWAVCVCEEFDVNHLKQQTGKVMEKDDRFQKISTDPRFRSLPPKQRKTKIDDRFKSMFQDKSFSTELTIDKRGKQIKAKGSDHLKKFYEISSDEDDDESDSEIPSAEDDVRTQPLSKSELKDKKRKRRKKIKEVESSDETSGDEGVTADQDFARGAVLMSSSEDSSDSDIEEVPAFDQEAHSDHYWGEIDKDADTTDESSCRLALMNMDWDRVKAVDIFILMNSFKPASGSVTSVTIYPSEFGKERMKEDDMSGPREIRKTALNSNTTDKRIKQLDDRGQKAVLRENMREYQLNRLKYFYAVVVLDSVETAEHVYTQCDGQEYLSSATKLDFRYIPDEMEFDESEVKDSANHIPDGYIPLFFSNTALGQSLVHCTWDETPLERRGVLNKKYTKDELESADITNYLASATDSESDQEITVKSKSRATTRIDQSNNDKLQSNQSEDDDSETENSEQINHYRNLLLGTDSKEEVEKEHGDGSDVDMEIAWESGLVDSAREAIQKKLEAKGKSVFERKREERKLKKKEEKRALKEQKKREKADKKAKKSKNKVEVEQEADEGSVQAFSDDEIPDGFDVSDLVDDDHHPVDKQEKSNKKKSKKKRHREEEEEGETEQKPEEPGDLDLLLMDSDEEGPVKKRHFNMTEIEEYENMTKSKRKRKLKKNQLRQIEDDFQIDVTDDRFSALYKSANYNIDPSSQQFRKTKAMTSIISEKQKRVSNRQDSSRKHKSHSQSSKSQDNTTGAISSLVKSIKAKTLKHKPS